MVPARAPAAAAAPATPRRARGARSVVAAVSPSLARRPHAPQAPLLRGRCVLPARAPALRARPAATRRGRPSSALRCGALRCVAAAGAAEDFYAVLGVEATADAKALKSAYRKLALKYHPDVNKAPDAADRFRRIKAAYTTLSDPSARAQYDRSRRGGGGSWGRSGSTSSSSGGGFGGGFDFDFGSYGSSSGSKGGKSEEFYGLGDFFRDLDKELSGFEKRRGAGGSSGREKSLMEELADIGLSVGEELVEFLEMGLSGVEDPTKAAKNNPSSSSRAEPSARSSDAQRTPPPPPPRAPPPPPKTPPRSAEQSVDDMLRQLKKDMGLD